MVLRRRRDLPDGATNICDECEQEKDITVVLGEVEDHEFSRTVYLCVDCLRSAVVYCEDHAHQP